MSTLDIVVAAVADGTTPADVEAATGLPAGTVRVLLRRAVARGRLVSSGYGRYAGPDPPRQSPDLATGSGGQLPTVTVQPADRSTGTPGQLSTVTAPPTCPNPAHRLGIGGWFTHNDKPVCTACLVGETVPCWLCGDDATAVSNDKPVCRWCNS